MRTEWRERATQAYSLLIGGAGLAVLIYATVLDPPRIVLPAYFLFLLLSIVVKRTSIHVAHDVEHSLVGIVDIAAILIFGGVVGGWVAAISAAVLLDLRAVRRQQVNRQSLFVRPLFNAGLKALLSLLSAWVFVQLGGEIGAASLRASQWIPLGGMILVWFVVDHVAWGVAVWLRDGWAGLIEFFRTIWRYSLLVELAPLPFALFVALTYMVVGWGGFLFLSAILVVASWVLSRWSDATRQLELRVTEMETFGRVAQALANAPLDVGDLARLVHAFTQKLIDPPDFQLGLLNSDRHTFHLACWTVDRQMKEPDDVAITSAIEWLRRSQRTILVRDFEHADAPFSPARIGRLPRSEVLVPMIVKGEMTGFLSVQSPLPDEFDANDANALAAIAHQAAIAIENARLYEQEQQRANQLEAVAEAGRNLASILDLNELLSTVVRVIQERFGYYHVQVFVLDQNTHQAVFRASSSSELEALWRQCGREVSPGSIGIIAWVAKNGQALLANDVATEPLYTPDDPVLLPDTRAELAVPIRIEESVVGVLDVQSATQYAFSAEDEFVLTALSDELAVAIDAARMHMATREEAWISTVLLQAAESISRLENLEEVLAAIVRMTTLLAGVESCVIWLWSEDGASLDVAEAYGRGAEWRERVMQMSVAPADAPAFDQVRESQQRLLLDQDVPADIMPAEWRALLGEDQLLIMPLIGKGEVLGLMTVDCATAGGRMSDRRVEMLVGIAHQAAVAIDGAQVYALQQVNAYVATVLLEVSRAVARSRDLSNILNNVVRMTPMVIGADRCVMFARSQMGKDEVSIHHYGLGDEELQRIGGGDWPYYDELQRLAEAGQAAMVTRDEKWSGALKDRVTLIEGDEPLLALPLMAKGEYAGVLVVTYYGVPERFAERWLRILMGIASQSATAIENDWLHRQDLERERMERELDVAHEIQASFLPSEVPPMPGWEVATMWRAARQVAGDFYDLIPLSDHRVGVLIADVADKGVPAALFMALSRTLIKAIALSGRPANVVLERANNLILADAASDMFVTTFYGVVDLNVHRLSYASGGHNPALLVRAGDDEVVLLKPYGMALGIIENIEIGLDSVDIKAGDVLVLYTDGITEAIDVDEQEFGLERLIDVVQRTRGEPAEAIIRAVTEALESHVRGEPPFDDATMMVLKRVCE